MTRFPVPGPRSWRASRRQPVETTEPKRGQAMIYGRMGGQVKLLRMATPEDAKLDSRKPDKQDRERCAIGYLMVGRFIHEDGTESEDRLFDLAYLKADGGIQEIYAAAKAAGNTIAGGTP